MRTSERKVARMWPATWHALIQVIINHFGGKINGHIYKCLLHTKSERATEQRQYIVAHKAKAKAKPMFYSTHSSMTQFCNALPTPGCWEHLYSQCTRTQAKRNSNTLRHRLPFLHINLEFRHICMFFIITSHARIRVLLFLFSGRCLLFTFSAVFCSLLCVYKIWTWLWPTYWAHLTHTQRHVCTHKAANKRKISIFFSCTKNVLSF